MPKNVIMTKRTIIFYAIGCMLMSSVLTMAAGEKKEKFDKKKTIKAADKAYKDGLIFASADLYQRVLDNDPNNVTVLMNFANSFYQARDYESAERAFAQAFRADSAGNTIALYYQALMIKMQGRYNEA